MTDIKRKPREYYQRAFPGPFNNLPPAVLEKKPGQLSDAQIRQFFDEVSSFYTILTCLMDNNYMQLFYVRARLAI